MKVYIQNREMASILGSQNTAGKYKLLGRSEDLSLQKTKKMSRYSNTDIRRSRPQTSSQTTAQGNLQSVSALHYTQQPASPSGASMTNRNMIQLRITRLFRKAPHLEAKLSKQKGPGAQREATAGRTVTLQGHCHIPRGLREASCPSQKNKLLQK